MIKRSNPSNQLLESRGWWKRGSRRRGEWTYEGGRKRKRVVTDGVRTRYQSVTVWLYSKGADDVSSIWVVPQEYTSLVP